MFCRDPIVPPAPQTMPRTPVTIKASPIRLATVKGSPSTTAARIATSTGIRAVYRDAAWAAGAALSIEEAIAYVQRRRGERKRAASGWTSLTRAELDVVKLVSEGLGNKDVAARLFVSPRTVQAHLTHIYTKLGLTSRVQLAQEAARHG